MCGIAGFMSAEQVTGGADMEVIVRAMGDRIAHRGPDADDAWIDAENAVALSHRRLAVIDLTENGRQPMRSPSGCYRITYNGEIYNYREVRRELEAMGVRFTSDSDTEVLLGAIDEWGIEAALQRVNGMFAFALWDVRRRRLVLARDRFGEKPLYYGWQTWRGTPTLLFGSELSALRAHPAFEARVDRQALAAYLRHAYVPAPLSIFAGIYKLPPATYLAIDPANPHASLNPIPYWSLLDVAEDAQPLSGLSLSESADRLDGVLRRAVRARVVADVPIGAFLSGGIDSSLIVAMMQAQADAPVRTFSIGFTSAEYDEARDAAKVAAHLGTDHTELYVTPREALDVIPLLPSMYSEPFADSSQIPTHLVSVLARRSVTVALSGDGGDEIFGGYNRYRVLDGLWNRIDRIPRPVRRMAARLVNGLPATSTDRVLSARALSRLLPDAGRRTPGAKLRKLSSIMAEPNAEAAYRRLTSVWPDPCAKLLHGVIEPPTVLSTTRPDLPTPALRAMALDSLTYLPDDILAKVDRASMAVALECRVPFLDPEVLSCAWSLPIEHRVGASGGKLVLRELLARYVPTRLTDRPKMGFGVPLAEWLRGPLRNWAGDLMSQATWLDKTYLDEVWAAHTSGRSDSSHQLWAVLMACQWSDATGTTLADPAID